MRIRYFVGIFSVACLLGFGGDCPAAETPAAEGAATSTSPIRPAEPAASVASAARGFRLLTTKAYLTPDFDQEVFDRLYTVWDLESRRKAEAAAPAERRRMAFERYGLTEYPDAPRRTALQYVDDGAGNWVMNCLACHTGKVAGQVVLGAPNTLFALQTLTEEVRAVKQQLQKPLTHMDKGSLLYPLGGTVGTTNAVAFGQILLWYRDAELKFHPDRPLPSFAHVDEDAPPWWHYRRKSRLYIDGFAPKDCRALMQFLLIPRNGRDKFDAWESDFRDIEAWIESLEPPKYPYPIDQSLAAAGRTVFNRQCADCHGTYGTKTARGTAGVEDAGGGYPEKNIPIDVIGTDAVRFKALTAEGRRKYGESWFARGGKLPVVAEPAGYVAPPLDGIWASAPYLHNGSVPTLVDLLSSETRPKVWTRTADGYDTERVGVEATRFDDLPSEARDDPRLRRRYFDTRQPGKSAAGHTFPDALSPDEKRAVLEYLKTL
jgi:mono/diheme cytochrome c family protein